MAISFVGSHVGTHAAITAQTVNFSSLLDAGGGTPTLAAGDIVFVAVENASTVDRTEAQLTPSGYTPAHADDYRNDSNDSNFLVSYKVMGGTPDTSVAIPASNATTAGVGYAIFVFRGVNTANPFDVTTQVTGAINTGKANAPAIEPVTAGAWIVVFGGAAVAAGAVFTNPGDLSATTNHFRSATITSTTNDANICGGIKTDWSSGSFDPTVFGGSTTTNTGSWSAASIALKPIVTHAATGAIVGPGAVVVGSAARTSPAVTHDASGALAGQGATVAGSTNRFRAHISTGALFGQGTTIAGSAARAVGAVSHAASGALTGAGAVLSAAASRFRAFASSGVLTGAGSVLTGLAARFRAHASSGAMAGPGATLDGAAALTPGGAGVHAAVGALIGAGAVLIAAALLRVRPTFAKFTRVSLRRRARTIRRR